MYTAKLIFWLQPGPPKPLQVGQWVAVAYKEGHSGDWIVKAFQGEKAKIKFFDYRGGGQYTPTQKASELVDPKYIYLVDFPTRKLMGEKIQNLARTEKVHQTTLSKVIAAQWRALSDTDKQPFYDRAAEFKRAHLVYPTYRYRPRKKPAKKTSGTRSKQMFPAGNTAAKRNKFKSRFAEELRVQLNAEHDSAVLNFAKRRKLRWRTHKRHLHPMTVSKLQQPPLSLKHSPRSLGFREAGQL
ncbi:Transcription factor SOX-6 [Branchiostoma belcheri]|nr:Transcription factor SOX-6 [Branchiostoma belcheri]